MVFKIDLVTHITLYKCVAQLAYVPKEPRAFVGVLYIPTEVSGYSVVSIVRAHTGLVSRGSSLQSFQVI